MSIIRGQLATCYRSLLNVFEAGLDAGHERAIANCLGRNAPEEPDHVLGIFQTSIDLFDSGLKSLLQGSGIRASVSGVYCHQSPKVTWPTIREKGSVELGDLLIVVMAEENGIAWNNAILLQAKMGDWVPRKLPSDDQFDLYNSWPRFSYLASAFTPKDRQVTPSAPHSGGQYLVFSHEGHLPYRVSDLCSHSTNPPHFCAAGFTLAQLCLGGSGRVFSDEQNASLGIDWDRVVWDLLRRTASHTLRRSNSGVKSFPRGRLNFIAVGDLGNNVFTRALALSGVHGGELPPDLSEVDKHDDDDMAGISIIAVSLQI